MGWEDLLYSGDDSGLLYSGDGSQNGYVVAQDPTPQNQNQNISDAAWEDFLDSWGFGSGQTPTGNVQTTLEPTALPAPGLTMDQLIGGQATALPAPRNLGDVYALAPEVGSFNDQNTVDWGGAGGGGFLSGLWNGVKNFLGGGQIGAGSGVISGAAPAASSQGTQKTAAANKSAVSSASAGIPIATVILIGVVALIVYLIAGKK